MRQEHFEKGNVNAYTRDRDSVITNYGKHDRTLCFIDCKTRDLVARVDHLWNLGMPSITEILTVAKKHQDIKGKWILDKKEEDPNGKSTEFYFKKP